MAIKYYTSIDLRDNNSIVFEDASNSNTITFKAPATLTSSFSITLPPSIVPSGYLKTDASGNLTFVVLTSTEITDFDEAAQDAVGSILTDSTSIDFTYNDAANTITATVLPGGVNHNLLNNYVANEHVDHTSVSIATSATSGLTGGGDISTTRNIRVAPNLATSKSTAEAADEFLIADSSDSSNLKKITLQKILDLAGLFYHKTNWVTADGTTKTVTHSLGTKDVIVQLFDIATGNTIHVDEVTRTDVNNIQLTASEAPPAGGWRILILAMK